MPSRMQFFLSAGEPSGDLHGANLARELRLRRPDIELVGFGGDTMAAAGVDLHYPLTHLAITGINRVVPHLAGFFKLARRAEVYFRTARPTALVVIDYPGFHWALAKRAHRAGVPVYYFVPPQLWAWAGWRVSKMRRWVKTVLTALPFEDEWYRSRGVNTHYIGHPYFDEIAEQKLDAEFVASLSKPAGPLVALLPGSRNQEVDLNFPLQLKVAARIRVAVPDVRFAVAAFNDKQAGVVRRMLSGSGLPIEVYVKRTPEIIEAARTAVAVSGSVGLELLARLTPTAIVYRVEPIPHFFSRPFMTCKYISLVNLLADEPLYPEFLTTSDDPDPIARPVIEWLKAPERRLAMIEKLRNLRSKVAVPGACARAAEFLLNDLAPLAPRKP